MNKFRLLCAASAFAFPATAMAQSAGTVEFEEEAIVVTGSRTPDVAGIQIPDTSKTRQALDAEFIQRQVPGQSINETLNNLPGVSFTNNDPFGSSGGTLVIRGFDNSRISETFDGVPLNDTGNYALFSNQLLDPELIEQVNVSLGSTDVDSPTAAATGSTVNFRTRRPFEDFGVRLQGSYGNTSTDADFMRVFGVVDTGTFTPWGTRAFGAASMATNDFVYGNRGVIYKQQYNGRLFQPVGDSGDFISVSGHYNQNRNNFGGSGPLRLDLTACPTDVPGQTPAQIATCSVPRIVGSGTGDRFPRDDDERQYTVAPCQINQVARPGTADFANSCGSTFDERFNPSNTGNIRVASLFHLTEALTLNVEPSFQYVKANGGGTVVAQEGFRDVNPAGGTATPNQCVTGPNVANRSCQTGYLGGTPFFGRDLNGDGDRLDTVRILAPSITQTDRYGLIAGLRYELNDAHSFRVNYSYDRGRHRQTGEVGFLQNNGVPFDVFPSNDPLSDAGSNILQKRDRRSIALLHQISGEYRGEFLDGALQVNAGARVPFFRRDLNNFCATTSPTGFVECFTTNDAGLAAFLANNPTQVVGPAGATAPTQGPQRRVFEYSDILPNIGAVYDFAPRASVFVNYSRGLQVPSTDFLYNTFFFPTGDPRADPEPETTDNFDVGFRYRSSNILAQVSGWYTIYQNRLAEAYDPETDRNVFRNLGTVHKYGVDASVAWQFRPELSFYLFGSYLWSDIKDDVAIGDCGTLVSAVCPAGSAGQLIFARTQGRRESGAPVYTLGGRIQAELGPVEIGITAKRTGPRYVNDVNLPISLCFNATGGNAYVNNVDCPATARLVEVFSARAPAYNVVNLDIRVPLGFIGLNDETFFQLNVSNLFDEFFVNNPSGQILNTTVPFVNFGAPRAVIGTLVVGFR